MRLFDALGLDLRIFIAQLINFSVLIFVLWRFAYKPILKVLDDRRLKIAKGVEDSNKAEERLAQAEAEKKEVISLARKEANEIIEEAKQKAELRYQEIIAKTKLDIKLLIDEEKEKIEGDRKQAVKAIKKEAAQMVVSALAKILPERVDKHSDNEMIEAVLKDLK